MCQERVAEAARCGIGRKRKTRDGGCVIRLHTPERKLYRDSVVSDTRSPLFLCFYFLNSPQQELVMANKINKISIISCNVNICAKLEQICSTAVIGT